MLKNITYILGITVCTIVLSSHIYYTNNKYGIKDKDQSPQILNLMYSDTTRPQYHMEQGKDCVYKVLPDETLMGTKIYCTLTSAESSCKSDSECKRSRDQEEIYP